VIPVGSDSASSGSSSGSPIGGEARFDHGVAGYLISPLVGDAGWPLPLFRYPECVSDYELAINMKGGWKTVAAETGNYFRRRVHGIEPVSSDRLRLSVTATNGARTARVYAIRVYNGFGV
jgi:hypothetical protein